MAFASRSEWREQSSAHAERGADGEIHYYVNGKRVPPTPALREVFEEMNGIFAQADGLFDRVGRFFKRFGRRFR